MNLKAVGRQQKGTCRWGPKSLGLVLLVLLCSGCDALYRLLDKEGAQEKKLIGEVVPFTSNPTVEEVQRLLKLYGYSIGTVDGVLGARTRHCIEQFQQENGLKVTRFVDEQTWLRLREFKDNGFLLDYALNVPLLQETLQRHGFNPGPIDGKMGARTQKAIKDFQQAKGLKVDGKVGYQTLKYLNAPFVEDVE